MQVFNLFFKITKTKYVSMLIYLAIFLLILNLTNANSVDSNYKASEMRLAVFDEDNTEASRALIKFLDKSHELVEIENDDDKLIDAMYITEIHYAITINSGYEKKLAAGETEGLFSTRYIHDNYTNKLADDTLNSYVSTVNAFLAGGNDLNSAIEKTEKVLSEKTEVHFETFSNNKSAGNIAGFFNYLPYAIFSLVISILSPVIISMNKKEVAFRTKCSSISESSVNIQLVLASIVYVSVIWLFLMGIGVVKNGGFFTGTMLYTIINTIAFTIVSISIALLLAAIGLSENSLGFITQILGLGMAFLCGMFVPVEFLAKEVLAIGRFLPAYWYVKANNMICASGNEVFDAAKVIKCTLVELLFAAAIMAVTVIVRKQKKVL